MSAPAYVVRGLGASLGGTPILHQIDLELRAGCWTAVVGPNGAGKSTLLRAIAGLLPCSGQVELLGRELHDWPRQQRARALSWLGQNQSAADDLTVHDVAMLGRLPHQSWLAPASERSASLGSVGLLAAVAADAAFGGLAGLCGVWGWAVEAAVGAEGAMGAR